MEIQNKIEVGSTGTYVNVVSIDGSRVSVVDSSTTVGFEYLESGTDTVLIDCVPVPSSLGMVLIHARGEYGTNVTTGTTPYQPFTVLGNNLPYKMVLTTTKYEYNTSGTYVNNGGTYVLAVSPDHDDLAVYPRMSQYIDKTVTSTGVVSIVDTIGG